MDWSGLNFDWNRARAFLVTAEEGSFSAAARALGLSQPTLGRQVAGLEEELGVTLFDRPSGGLALTEAGDQLMAHLRTMGEAAHRFSLVASGQSESVEGHVKISAAELTAVYLLPSILRDLHHDHPGITLEVIATNDLSDLARREADIAVRNADPKDPDLIARRLSDEEGNFFAHESWLATNKAPTCPADFADTPLLGFDDNDQMIDFLSERDLPVQKQNIRLMSGSHMTHWAMVQAGCGIGLASQRVASLTPGIRCATPWHEPIRFPIWLVAHRDLLKSKRIRIVYDRLAEQLPKIGKTPGLRSVL